MNINILSCNIRGLGKSKRRKLVKDILLEHKIDVVSLQEIKKKEEFRERTLKNLSLEITNWLILPSNGRSGGILVDINENKFEILDH
jgi:exonuclease III